MCDPCRSRERADLIAGCLDSIREALHSPAALEDIGPDDYDLVFSPGGHGPMEDLAVNDASGRILTRTLDSGAVLGRAARRVAVVLHRGRWRAPAAGWRDHISRAPTRFGSTSRRM